MTRHLVSPLKLQDQAWLLWWCMTLHLQFIHVLDSLVQSSHCDASYVSTCFYIVAFAMQEICSFLKGSSEALDSPGGKLTLEAYLEVHHHSLPLWQAAVYTCALQALALQHV